MCITTLPSITSTHSPPKNSPPPSLQPTQPSAPCSPLFPPAVSWHGEEGPFDSCGGGKWCGVGGSRCSWSLIVWLVHSGFSSRVSSSQRGEEREKRFLTAHLHHVDWCVLVQNKASLIVTAVFQGGRETFEGSFRSIPLNQCAGHLFGFARLLSLLKMYHHIFINIAMYIYHDWKFDLYCPLWVSGVHFLETSVFLNKMFNTSHQNHQQALLNPEANVEVLVNVHV